MSQTIEEKDKKISDLRGLLTQAKTKIEEYKAQLLQKVFESLFRKKKVKKSEDNMKKVCFL